MKWSAGCRVAIAVLVIATLGAPGDAEAQFKKLKNAITGKAADEAVEGATGSCFANRRPTVVASLPLSAEEIARVNAGLDAEMAAAPGIEKTAADDQKKADAEQKAYEKAKADYDKAYEKYSKCRDKFEAADNAQRDALNAKTDAAGQDLASSLDTTKLMALAEKAQIAAQRISEGKGTAADRKTVADFQAMMNPISAKNATAMAAMQDGAAHDQGASARLEKACGKEPQEPKQPGYADNSPESALLRAGAGGAKMDPADYRIARELVIMWASSNTVVAGGGGGGGGAGGGKADAQNQALKEAAGKLCAMKKANLPT